MKMKDIVLILTSVVTIASILVKLTPSKMDDNIVAKILEFLALNKK